MTPELVLDASVAVKWIRRETGSEEATSILQEHMDGVLRAWLPEMCATELLVVARRAKGPAAIEPVWESLQESGMPIVPLTPELVAEAATQCERLDCSFYDAVAPALAVLVGATLVSADARAHRSFPGVRLLG